MKAVKKITALFLTAAFLCAPLLACAKQPPEFVFSAAPDTQILGTGILTLTVETKNEGGEYEYHGSSTKIGAVPELYCIIRGEKFTLACAPEIETGDYVDVKIKKGEVIKKEWHFSNDGAYGAVCPGGVYTLRLEFFGVEQIIPAFIIVSDEGKDVYAGGVAEEDYTDEGSYIIL